MSLNNDIQSVLYSEEQLRQRVCEMGAQITKDYQGKDKILLVSVLKGSYIFMADLSRAIDLPVTIDFMVVSSYGNGTSTTGAVRINKDLSRDIEGKNVIIVEDILDSGVTLNYLTKYLENRKPASITIATLMDKPERRRAEVNAKYVGFVIPDAFVVGYGLDYAEEYRNLPYVGILKPEVYE